MTNFYKGNCRGLFKVVFILLLSVSVLIPGCSGGGGGGHHATSKPFISNGQYSPHSTEVTSELVTVTATMDFTDDDGNLNTVTFNLYNDQDALIDTKTSSLQNVANITSGNLKVDYSVIPSIAGIYTFEMFVTDADGHKSNILTGTFEVTATSSPLSELYGLMTLNYKFDTSTTTYTDRAHFSPANLNSDETIIATIVEGKPNRAIGCSTSPALRSHMCVIVDDSTGTKEIFLFNLNNGQITNGLYEYCMAGVTTEECTSDIVTSPDGTAWGTVESTKKAEILFNESTTSSDYASKETIKRNIGEVNAIAQELSAQQQQAVDKLSTHMEALSNQATCTKGNNFSKQVIDELNKTK